jgi:hypothetical protein
MKCKYCGKDITKGEENVNWPWIHENGWYQCVMGDIEAQKTLTYGVKAEPEEV